MLKLQLGSRVISSPNIHVLWCLDMALLNQLRDREIQHVHVLVTIARNYEDCGLLKEERFLVPLERGEHYIPVSSPGRYLISAAVVVGESSRDLHRGFLGKTQFGAWKNDVLDLQERHFFPSVSENFPIDDISAHIDIEVPNEIFAKKPFDWEWVTLWTSKNINQCRFRKQRFVAYSVQLVCIAVWLIVIMLIRMGFVLSLLALATRVRFINVKALFDPFAYSFSDIHKGGSIKGYLWFLNCSIFGCDGDGKRYDNEVDSIILMQAFWPGFYPLGFFAWIIVNHFSSCPLWSSPLFVMFTVPVIGLLIYIIISLFIWIVEKVSEAGKRGPVVTSAAETPVIGMSLRMQKRISRQYALFQKTVSCDVEVLPVMRRRYLPITAKAVMLFADVKAKVCRYYAS